MREIRADHWLAFDTQLRDDDHGRVQEVIGDLQSALKTYELTKMRYADDEEHM